MKILIIADTDLDGTGTAAIIKWYYQCKSFWKPKVDVCFPDRGELNENFADPNWATRIYKKYDLIYLCDTGLDSEEANKYLGTILAPKTIYFDHHESNFKRQEEYVKNFKGFYVKEGARCSAKIAYDVLLKEFEDPGSIWKTRKWRDFQKIKEFAHLVNDYDMWIRKYIRSTQLADVVTEIGPYDAHEEFVKICLKPNEDSDITFKAWQRAKFTKDKSRELGEATLVKHRNYKVPFYTAIIDGYQSEVGSDLVHSRGMIAVFNIRTKSVSFRIGSDFSGMKYSRNKTLDCLDFAELFGGGGHPMAAGVGPANTEVILKEMARSMGHFLLEEEKNERQRKRGSGSAAKRSGPEPDSDVGKRDPDKP